MKHFNLLFITLFTIQIINGQQTSVADVDFWQEYHEPYPVPGNFIEKEVRSIAVDNKSDVWIATAAGILKKKEGDSVWTQVLSENDKGPSFAVATDNESNVWMGTWKGVFLYKNNELKFIGGTEGPVSAICSAKEGVYALGPNGVWLYNGNSNYSIARSIRHVISDDKEGIWIATDVGLYHCTAKQSNHFYKTDVLLSAYIKGLALDEKNKLWAGGLGGVSILQNEKKRKNDHSKRRLSFYLCKLCEKITGWCDVDRYAGRNGAIYKRW